MRAPEGWRSVRLKDIAFHVTEKWEPGEGGNYPYIGLENIGQGTGTVLGIQKSEGISSIKTKFSQNDVLFGKLRPNLRKTACVNFSGIASTDIIVLRAIEKIEPKFLFFIVNEESFFSLAVRSAAGTKMPRTSWNLLGEYPISIPPLSEQRRIAEILSSVDEAIEATQAVIEQTRTVKQGVLNRLLTKGIGHTRFKKTEIGTIPEKWTVAPLKTVAHVQTGAAKGKKDIDNPVELPYLRVANVQDGHIDLTTVKTITVSASQIERYSLQVGDVLMTEGGDFDKLGRGDVWRGQISPCLHQNHVFAVRPNPDVLMPEFLTILTGSSYGKSYFLSCAKQTTNLASINSTQVKDFPVLLPDRDEQEKIVAVVQALSKAEQSAQNSLEKTMNIKSALLSDLLTGRKRVPAALLTSAE
ncbi:restriction endonuclease subunit S [Azospirillum cavernae]|uniref:Restriction endonuclease subunit S n=1 Tax=Azospirillum cavernae TaxID=2320860 RepID=A0A418VV13_9PROT|nr:restriction endonuclease subunit S [Azospirillum cavernae]RJF80964.1 restriction endonuclease subunit S [Azospirillum cavernae]